MSLFKSNSDLLAARDRTVEALAMPASSLCPRHGMSISSRRDRKSTRLNSSHLVISYAVFCLKKKTYQRTTAYRRNRRGHNTHCTTFSHRFLSIELSTSVSSPYFSQSTLITSLVGWIVSIPSI